MKHWFHGGSWLVVIYIIVISAWLGSDSSPGLATRRGRKYTKLRPMISAEYINISGSRVDSYVGIPINKILIFGGRKESWLDVSRVWFAFGQCGDNCLRGVRECAAGSIYGSNATLVDEVRPTPIYHFLYNDLCGEFCGGCLSRIVYDDWGGYGDIPRRLVYHELRASSAHIYPRSLVCSHLTKLLKKDEPSENGNYDARESEDGHYSFEPRQSPPSWLGWIHLFFGVLLSAGGFGLFIGREGRSCTCGLILLSIGGLVMAHGFYLLL